MGRVGAEDDSPVAQFGATQCAGRADAGLADSAFPGIEKNSHQFHSVTLFASARSVSQLVIYKKVRRTARMVPECVRNLRRPVRRYSAAESSAAVVIQMTSVTSITQSFVRLYYLRLGYFPLVVIVVTATIAAIVVSICPGIDVGVLFSFCREDVHKCSENPETVFEL